MTQPAPLPPRPPGVPPWPGGPCVATDVHREVCCEQRAAVGECDCAEFLVELAAAPKLVGRWW